VIRQAISCDICGSEKQQTNHWFVATDQGGELRVAGWNSRNRLRPNTKHLCGQICLHKLVDLFISGRVAVQAPAGSTEEVAMERLAPDRDASLISAPAYVERESPSTLVARPEPAPPQRLPQRVPAELVPMPGRPQTDGHSVEDEAPRYASRNWRAEAWDRERERELRAVERRPDVGTRRRSGS
jgi:hypothetical protein